MRWRLELCTDESDLSSIFHFCGQNYTHWLANYCPILKWILTIFISRLVSLRLRENPHFPPVSTGPLLQKCQGKTFQQQLLLLIVLTVFDLTVGKQCKGRQRHRFQKIRPPLMRVKLEFLRTHKMVIVFTQTQLNNSKRTSLSHWVILEAFPSSKLVRLSFFFLGKQAEGIWNTFAEMFWGTCGTQTLWETRLKSAMHSSWSDAQLLGFRSRCTEVSRRKFRLYISILLRLATV